MRALLLLVPLVLSSCALLPIVGGPGLPPPPPGGIPHEGYVLVCEGVLEEACREEADRVAAHLGPDREIGWIVIRPEGHEVCYTEALGVSCEGTSAALPT